MIQKRFHIILDLTNVSSKKLTDQEGLSQFLTTLPGQISMHVLKGPIIAEGIPENPGLSGFVIIDYSHISVHTFTANNEALIDIFSCKPFEKEDAISSVLKYFNVPRENARINEVFWG